MRGCCLAAGGGFEPPLPDPKSGVLPLDDPATRTKYTRRRALACKPRQQLRQLMGHSDYTVLRQYLALVEADLKQAHQQHSPLNNLRNRKR